MTNPQPWVQAPVGFQQFLASTPDRLQSPNDFRMLTNSNSIFRIKRKKKTRRKKRGVNSFPLVHFLPGYQHDLTVRAA